MQELDPHWEEVMDLAVRYGFICQAFTGVAVLSTHKNQLKEWGKEKYSCRQKEMFPNDAGTPNDIERLSGDYNRGYTKAIQDLQDIFTYIQPNLKQHHKNLTGKLSLALLACCLENREKLRERREGFIRFNGQAKNFEWHDTPGRPW